MSSSVDVAEEIIDVETADGPMAVSVKYPADGAWHPTIAVFHDGPGMRESNHVFNRMLAAEGYRVVMPDLYHRHGRMLGWESSEATDETRAQVMQMLLSLTDDGIQSDMDDALAAIDLGDDEQLGTIGFCLGAREKYLCVKPAFAFKSICCVSPGLRIRNGARLFVRT